MSRLRAATPVNLQTIYETPRPTPRPMSYLRGAAPLNPQTIYETPRPSPTFAPSMSAQASLPSTPLTSFNPYLTSNPYRHLMTASHPSPVYYASYAPYYTPNRR